MSDAGHAVKDMDVKTAPKQRTKPNERTQPKKLPPYAVVVLNDDYHSFPYVIEMLQKVFGYGWMKSFGLTFKIHTGGRAIVWSGSLEVAEFKRERIVGYGPDIYARREVKFPLGCVIEPLPE